ncbi:hypothetical protein pb186bvf_011897 [Paramecium bursaria]
MKQVNYQITHIICQTFVSDDLQNLCSIQQRITYGQQVYHDFSGVFSEIQAIFKHKIQYSFTLQHFQFLIPLNWIKIIILIILSNDQIQILNQNKQK